MLSIDRSYNSQLKIKRLRIEKKGMSLEIIQSEFQKASLCLRDYRERCREKSR